MGYRFIKSQDSEIAILEKASKTGIKNHIRAKCDTILLSNRGYDDQSLSELYQVRTHTIRAWINTWVEKGLNGFSISAGRGRKPEIKLDNTYLVNSIKLAGVLITETLKVFKSHQFPDKFNTMLQECYSKIFSIIVNYLNINILQSCVLVLSGSQTHKTVIIKKRTNKIYFVRFFVKIPFSSYIYNTHLY